MGSTQNVDMSSQEVEIKVVETSDAEDKTIEKKVRKVKTHSKKYMAVKSKVDKTKSYDLPVAIEMIKKLSYSSFDGTITAEIVVKEAGASAEVTLPHQSGKAKKIAIVDEKVLKDIEAGKIDFDILISAPEFMPKLAKFARVLGPKGLMPNPKNGTLTPNPERAVKELGAGKMLIKTERKHPLIHISIGKVSLEDKKLAENMKAVIKAFQTKIVRVSLSASMSPSIKVNWEID